MLTEELVQGARQYLMDTYARYPLALARGQGTRVYDVEGREYLDFIAGIAVNVLGHCHPKVTLALQQQAHRLMHTSNLFYTEPQVQLARVLVTHSFAGKVFFCNSGAEANEAAIKLARRWAHEKDGAGRYEIVSMLNSFHGRTLATLTATGQEKVQKGFEPLPEGFRYVPFNDAEALSQAVTSKTAAVLLEIVQGEGGVQVVTPAFLKACREISRERGALLILDEVQTGIGRTGRLFAYEHFGVTPDVMTLAKGLGGGVPIGACLATDDVAKAFTPGSHASTFGGNPLVCAAALAVLAAILEDQDLLSQCTRLGEYFMKGLQELQGRCPAVTAVRGLGLLIGVEVTLDARELVHDLRKRGILANATSERVLRFVPPLIVTHAEIDRVVTTLGDVIEARR
ncbi:MAG TPA: acetylornithine transaminase [Nitrospirales bacterium]|jgi:acetylornithine aminotransferase|nr:acetylornithine transaminase [Nitrospirales bacterium]